MTLKTSPKPQSVSRPAEAAGQDAKASGSPTDRLLALRLVILAEVVLLLLYKTVTAIAGH